MSAEFHFDVFLSHSAKDKPVVRELAARLKGDGVRVWLDEEQIKPGDSIPAKIEQGLEHSRLLVLCMSADAFKSDWAQLEAGTFRFRDPVNMDRRFVPLRLDDAPIESSLAQFLYVDWRPEGRELEYAKLLDVSRGLVAPPGAQELGKGSADEGSTIRLTVGTRSDFPIWYGEFSPDHSQVLVIPEALAEHDDPTTLQVWLLKTGLRAKILNGHTDNLACASWSPDGKSVLSGGNDNTIRLWEVDSGHCLRVFIGHSDCVVCLAWSPDGKQALSRAGDNTIRLWEVKSGRCVRVIEASSRGYPDMRSYGAKSVALSPDGRWVLSATGDNTIELLEVDSGRCLVVLQGHSDIVISLAWSPDGKQALSGADDSTIRLWEVESGRCLRVLEGHSDPVRCLAWSPDGKQVLSGSDDNTIRLWKVDAGRCLRVLKGHSDRLIDLAWDADNSGACSIDRRGESRVWNFSNSAAQAPTRNVAVSELPVAPMQIQYTNAKVLLVGESGVGKTGLSNYLAHGIKVQDDRPLSSTDGAWATHWPLRHDNKKPGLDREIWLWDFAGQVDYRLVHQLFMDDTTAAVLVFNPQNENPFEGLGHWDHDLQKASRKPFAKLLVAARVDCGGLVVSAASMKKFMKVRGFLGALYETSAKTGKGCDQLREAIVQAIDWKNIPETTSPALYHRLKQEILSLRDGGLVLIRLAELKQRMEMTLRNSIFELAELEAVVSLLAGPGMIQRLDFGGFILLRPEVLSRYAAAVVRKVRRHPQELGCIREDELLAGDLDYQDFKRLLREDEKVVLRALLEAFVSRAWCFRQPCDGTEMLTFPSYFRRERRDQPNHPSVLVTYRFDGLADDIYTTLVVRLHHTMAFNQNMELWRSAADFRTQLGAKLGFTLLRDSEGTSRFEIYFEPDVDGNSRVLFLRYVHDHLIQHARNVVRLRRYYCDNKICDGANEPFSDQTKIDKALALGGKGKVFCPDCGEAIVLRDVIEEKFDSLKIVAESRKMDAEVQTVLDNESRELMAVHHAGFIVAEAGQIYRGYTNSDHGIDGEIEFKDKMGRASGKRLYVQLKSGDSYLKQRERDGAEVFQIKNPRWADYWQQQAYAVMLVIRTSDGEIRWMDVSAYLKRESAGGKTVKQILFAGERFDALSVQNWRKKALSQSL